MIRLDGIARDFVTGAETVHAVRPLDLRINRGEYVAVMGASGSGKSTLLHLLALLDRPSAGHYWLGGEAVDGLSDGARARLRQRRIGMVFQAFHLIPRLSAAENIALPMVLAGTPPAARHARVAEILDALDLSTRAGYRPAQLSGGQRQRVAIGRAMVMHPALLLADEPTGNLDRNAGDQVIAHLEALNRDGVTLIIVTHDPLIGRRAQRRLQMDDGRLSTPTAAEHPGP